MSDAGSWNKTERSQRQQAVVDFRVLVGFEVLVLGASRFLA
jgi:hypothetical protein